MSTTITGNIKDLSGGAVTSNTYLRFILRGLNGNIPRVNGTALVAQNPGFGLTGYWFDLVPNASGQISGTLYSTRDAAGTGNGEIEAGGSLTAVWYGMVLFTGGNPSAEIPVHAKNGTTLDISSVSPITATPVATAPTGDTTYLRLDGSNITPVITTAYSATPTFTLPLSPSILTLFRITLTGNVTSSTLAGAAPGIIVFQIIQDGTGNRTFVWPTNVNGAQSPDPTASAKSTQAFFFDGTNAYPLGAMSIT